MKLEKCTKCSNDLPFSASKSTIVCPFCGATHKVEKYYSKQPSNLKASTKKKTDDLDAIIAACIIIS